MALDSSAWTPFLVTKNIPPFQGYPANGQLEFGCPYFQTNPFIIIYPYLYLVAKPFNNSTPGMTQLEMLRTTDATRHYPIFGVPTCTHRLRAIQAHLGLLTTSASDISFMWPRPSLNKWFTVPVDAAKKLYLPMTALLLSFSCYAEYVGYLSLFLTAELSRLPYGK